MRSPAAAAPGSLVDLPLDPGGAGAASGLNAAARWVPAPDRGARSPSRSRARIRAAALYRDRGTLRGLTDFLGIQPKPAKEDDLDPLLKILVDINLVKPPDASGKHEVIFDRWGIYDPDAVRQKLNQMFGERRVLEDRPRHTDHIHLNVRPTKLDPSKVKGFK